jgi:catechol-2,3-dioxygenase
MHDPRPDMAIGHIRLRVRHAAERTDCFVKLGIQNDC